jgi:hypothetical protein
MKLSALPMAAILGISAALPNARAAAEAATPSQDQIAAIRASCQLDYRAYCASVPTGGMPALNCLRMNLATLSYACRAAVNAVGESVSAPPSANPLPQVSTMSEAQKRKIELPSIRAATECYSSAVKSDPRLAGAIQQNRLNELIYEKTVICEPVLQQMVAVHDQLNGSGTGIVFFRGAYSTDLPRAVLARIKPEIDRLTAEAARQADAKSEALQHVRQTAELLKQRMYECTTKELFELVKSGETAAVISDAALTFCRQNIDATVKGFFDEYRQEYPNTTDANFPSFQTSAEDAIAKAVRASAVQVKASLAAQVSGAASPLSAAPATAPVAPGPPSATDAVNRSPTECLKMVRQGFQGKVYEADKLVTAMIDLCRPEIETSARAAFLQNPASTLETERQKAVAGAIIEAKQIVGTP